MKKDTLVKTAIHVLLVSLVLGVVDDVLQDVQMKTVTVLMDVLLILVKVTDIQYGKYSHSISNILSRVEAGTCYNLISR